MAQWNLCCGLLVIAVMAARHSPECTRIGSAPCSLRNTRGANDNISACGICGPPITVTLIATNYLLNPNFELNVTVGNKPQRELIHVLEDAAVKDPRFNFTAEYYGTLGYMITKINKLAASVSDMTYWEILEHTIGVSTYVPEDNETIVFNFTRWTKNTQR